MRSLLHEAAATAHLPVRVRTRERVGAGSECAGVRAWVRVRVRARARVQRRQGAAQERHAKGCGGCECRGTHGRAAPERIGAREARAARPSPGAKTHASAPCRWRFCQPPAPSPPLLCPHRPAHRRLRTLPVEHRPGARPAHTRAPTARGVGCELDRAHEAHAAGPGGLRAERRTGFGCCGCTAAPPGARCCAGTGGPGPGGAIV